MSALKDAELEEFLPRLEAELKSELLFRESVHYFSSSPLTSHRVQRYPMRQAQLIPPPCQSREGRKERHGECRRGQRRC